MRSREGDHSHHVACEPFDRARLSRLVTDRYLSATGGITPWIRTEHDRASKLSSRAHREARRRATGRRRRFASALLAAD